MSVELQGSVGAFPGVDQVSGVAERKGFEPLIQLSPYGALAKRCLQPLGHLSGAGLMP